MTEPRVWLEQRLGPLAGFELITDTVAPEPGRSFLKWRTLNSGDAIIVASERLKSGARIKIVACSKIGAEPRLTVVGADPESLTPSERDYARSLVDVVRMFM